MSRNNSILQSAVSAWRNLTEWLRYRVDRIFARGPAAQFALLAFLCLLVVAVGMTAYFMGLYSKPNEGVESIGRKLDNGGFWDSLWFSAKHLFDPASVTYHYGATVPIVLISMFLSISSLILFGALIGLVSSAIEHRLRVLEKGNSPVKERGHVLILGWNQRIISLLNASSEYNVNRKIVILSNYEISRMKDEIRAGLGARRLNEVILRTGSPVNINELKRVAFDQAYSIIIIGDESANNPGSLDIEVVKTLMMLASHKGFHEPKPKIAAEISERSNAEIAEIAAGSYPTAAILCRNEAISKILVHASRQPGLSTVYGDIFAIKGNDIYVQNFPRCSGRKFGEISGHFPNAIPVGVSRVQPGDRGVPYLPVLNPGKDYVIAADEWLIFLANDSRIDFQENLVEATAAVTPATRPFHGGQIESIAILGWNRNIYDILAEYDRQVKAGTKVTVYSGYDPAAVAQMMAAQLPQPLRNLDFNYEKGNSLKREFLERVHGLKPSCIVFLADHSDHSTEIDPDARNIMSLLLLRDIQCASNSARALVVCEMLDPDNRDLFEAAEAFDLIVSSELVGQLLIQVSQQIMLKNVFKSFLGAAADEILLKPAGHYSSPGTRVTFAEIFQAAQSFNEIALGVRIAKDQHNRAANYGITLNPRRDQAWTLEENDSVVAMVKK